MAPVRFLLVVLVISVTAIFFAYPLLLEESGGECSALEQRAADVASHDDAGLLTVNPLYGSTSSAPSGAAFAKDRYPILPSAVGCTVAFWRVVLDRGFMNTAAAAVPPHLPAPSLPVDPNPASTGPDWVIARDMTPNGDPISPATVFTLPLEALAVRVAYPSAGSRAVRFQLRQGKAVLASCNADWTTPGIAWCKFKASLRKGTYSIALSNNNVVLGQFPFAVIGR